MSYPSRAWIEETRNRNRARLGLAGTLDNQAFLSEVRSGALKTAVGLAVAIGLFLYWRRS